MFDVDAFIAECQVALHDAEPRLAVKEVLSRALSDPGPVAAALPVTKAELTPLYASPELTVLKVAWAPGMSLPPHDHLMWAVIGIYGGDEDNAFYRRTPEGIVLSGGKQLTTSDTAVLGDNTIHAVTNPRRHEYTGAIHVYGGDFLNKPRSIWDAETLEEQPATGDRFQRLFEAANAAAAIPPA